MDDADGLICAYVLDGQGGGREIGWNEIRAWRPEQGSLWIHLDRTHDGTDGWIGHESGLEPLICEALLAEETRPRTLFTENGLMVILRGVNLHPQADPEDMVSVRFWMDRNRIISLRKRRLMAVQDMRDDLAQGRGPKTPADFLVQIASRLIDCMGPVIEEVDDEVDDAEEQVLTATSHELRTRLADLRTRAIGLRRYIAPQRDAMNALAVSETSWLERLPRARLREVADRVTRYVEDLDAARERAAVTQEELAGRIAEQMNRTMYLLSIVAAIFLPLGLITGLLGINVAGIPGAGYRWAFTIVCGLLAVIAAALVAFFRWKKWL